MTNSPIKESIFLLQRMRVQIAAGMAVLLFLTGAVVAYKSSVDESGRLRHDMIEQARNLAMNLSISVPEYLTAGDSAAIENMLLRSVKGPGVKSIRVFNRDSKLYADVNLQSNGTYMVRHDNEKVIVPDVNKMTLNDLGDEMDVWVPVRNLRESGWINMKIDLHQVDQLKYSVLKQNLLNSFVAAFIITVILYYFVRRHVATIERYTRFASSLVVDAGDKVDVNRSSYELESLGDALNNTSQVLNAQADAIKKDLEEVTRLAAVPENSPEMILTINLKGDVVFLNYRARMMADVSGLKDQNIRQLLPDNMDTIIQGCIHDDVAVREVEKHFLDRTFLWSFAPLLKQEIIHCFGVDVTNSKRAEQQAHKAMLEKVIAEGASEAKSAFLANMSHEIRTPLTSIIGFSESLLETEMPMQERVTAINTIIRNSRHLMQVINDILDMTKIESGKLQLEIIPVSLVDIMEDINSIFHASAQSKGLEFRIDYDFPVPVNIETDPVRLKQVIMNLCSNAIKFTENGSVEVRVSFRKSSSRLEIEVSDTGIGLSKVAIKHLFTPFEQADASTTRRYGGTGLGLYVTRQLVEHLGGYIEVDSEPGKGSRFTVFINSRKPPLEYYDSLDQLSGIRVSEALDIPETLQGSVLLVEDSPDNQQLISMYIRKTGADVDVADNGGMAVEKMQQKEYDLVLMDMQMPVMDGLTATREVRRLGYKKPVVMLTANAMREDIDRCLAAGCDAYFTKPINRHMFNNLLAEYLQKTELETAELTPVQSTLLEEGDEFKAIVRKFADQLPHMLDEIEALYQRQDHENLKRKVHSLKGTGGNMGFMDITNTCARIEFEMAKNAFKDIEACLQYLRELNKRIDLAMKQWND